jgi:subfamily B ATP-binding cassette protein MsbA
MTVDATRIEQRRHLRRLAGMIRPYLGRIGLCLLLVLASTGIQLTLPLGIRHLFDSMLAGGDVSAMHLVTAVLFGIFVLRSLFSYFGQLMIQLISDRIIVELRYQLFRHLHALDIQFHHQQRVGDLMSRLNTDVNAIRNLAASLSISVIVNSLQLIGAASVMLYMNWKLGLMVLMVAPMTTVLSRMFREAFRRYSLQMQDEMAKSSVIAQESLSGMEVIKGFARDAHEAARYRDRLMQFIVVVTGARKTEALFNALLSLITSSSTIAIFWFGGLQVIDGSLSAGTLVAFLLYSQSTTGSIASLAQNHSSFVQAVAASRRVFEILDTAPRVADRPDAGVLQPAPADLRFEGVRFSYRPGSPVVDGIDFAVAPGETVALVGPSGAGKSTLFKLVSRFYDPVEGAITINGRDIRDYTLASLREAVAVVPQDVYLFGCSVRENIRYGRLDATDAEIESAARAANAHEFILALPQGYETTVGERGVQLSGGQRQRISIARALLKNAPILLLDEATSSIDGASEGAIQEAIERLKHKRTTLIVAHRLATVRNADRILVIDQGRIKAQPTYAELIAGETLRAAELGLRVEEDRAEACEETADASK